MKLLDIGTTVECAVANATVLGADARAHPIAAVIANATASMALGLSIGAAGRGAESRLDEALKALKAAGQLDMMNITVVMTISVESATP